MEGNSRGASFSVIWLAGCTGCCFASRAPSIFWLPLHSLRPQAFKHLDKMDKEAGSNPFAVTDPQREPVRGELFQRQIHRADLTAVKQIGAGQFGDVYLATQAIRTPNGPRPIPRAVKLLRGAATQADKEVWLPVFF